MQTLFCGTIQDWIKSAAGGFLNPFLYYLILLKAYTLLPAQLAQPLNYLWNLVLVLLSAPLLCEKLSIKGLAGLFIGFIGVFVIATRGDIFSLDIETPTGVALAAASTVIWALSWILTQLEKNHTEMSSFVGI